MRIVDRVEDYFSIKILSSCRTRNLRRKEAERKKTEFRKEPPTTDNQLNAGPRVEEGEGGSSSRDSVTTKPGGKKKIYSINGNVRAEKEEEEDLVRLMEEEGDDMWDCLSQNSLPAAHSAGQHSFRHNSLGKGNTFPIPILASVVMPRTLSSPSADEDEVKVFFAGKEKLMLALGDIG